MGRGREEGEGKEMSRVVRMWCWDGKKETVDEGHGAMNFLYYD